MISDQRETRALTRRKQLDMLNNSLYEVLPIRGLPLEILIPEEYNFVYRRLFLSYITILWVKACKLVERRSIYNSIFVIVHPLTHVSINKQSDSVLRKRCEVKILNKNIRNFWGWQAVFKRALHFSTRHFWLALLFLECNPLPINQFPEVDGTYFSSPYVWTIILLSGRALWQLHEHQKQY